MINYNLGIYDFQDSLAVPRFGKHMSIVELKVEAIDEDEAEKAKTREEEIQREMYLRKLGTRPTSSPQAINSDDFALMLFELKTAPTMAAKAETLRKYGVFAEVAEAIERGDEQEARRLIARICA